MGRALIGLHDAGNLKATVRLAKAFGYECDQAASMEEMRTLLSQPIDYDRCIMDINLGNPGKLDIAPYKEVAEKMKTRINSGLCKIIGISGNESAVELARGEGLNVAEKMYFSAVEFFKE